MTAICVGGGPSQPKAGFPETLVFATTLAGLVSPIPGLEWLIPILPFLGVLSYKLPDICAVDPPPIPAITATDVELVFNPFLSVFDASVSKQKFMDLLTWIIWYGFCECVTGAQPVRPAAPAAPANIPILQPAYSGFSAQLVTTPSNTKAFHGAPPANWQLPDFNDSAWVGVDSNTAATNGNSYVWFNGATLVNAAVSSLPDGLRIVSDSPAGVAATDAINIRWTFNLSAVPTSEPKIGIWWPFPAGGIVGGGAYINGVNQPVFLNPLNWLGHYKDLKVGRNVVAMSIAPPWNGGPRGFGMLLEWQGAGTQQLPTDCCELTSALLHQILSGVQASIEAITLIQRQAVPFAYVTSTVHAGLNGAGAIAISGLIGVKVTVTTLPATLGVEGTSPPKHFDLGFLTFGTADGFGQAVRLERNPQVILPARCSAFTDLDYDLAPGVVVTITELLREP